MKVAISGLNNTDNPAPGIGVAKSLRDEHTLIGMSYDPNEPGVYVNKQDTTYPDTISGRYLRVIYLGQVKRWANGRRIHVFVLPYNNYTQSVVLNTIFISKARLTEVINL